MNWKDIYQGQSEGKKSPHVFELKLESLKVTVFKNTDPEDWQVTCEALGFRLVYLPDTIDASIAEAQQLGVAECLGVASSMRAQLEKALYEVVVESEQKL